MMAVFFSVCFRLVFDGTKTVSFKVARNSDQKSITIVVPRLVSNSIEKRFDTMQDTHKPAHVFIPARDLGHDNWFVALTRGLLYLGCAYVFVVDIFVFPQT